MQRKYCRYAARKALSRGLDNPLRDMPEQVARPTKNPPSSSRGGLTIRYDPLVATVAASPLGNHLAGSRQVGVGVSPTQDAGEKMIIRLGNVKLSLAKNRDAAFVPKADFIRLVTDPHGV